MLNLLLINLVGHATQTNNDNTAVCIKRTDMPRYVQENKVSFNSQLNECYHDQCLLIPMHNGWTTL